MAIPLAIRAKVPMLQGRTIMASVGYDPLATLAPMSALFCCWIFGDSRPSSLLTNPLRPLISQLFGHHAQAAVGEDKVDGCHPLVAIQRIQQVLGEDGAAGAGNGNGQGSRRWISVTRDM